MIELIVADLVSHKNALKGKLIVTGDDPIPVEISQGAVSRRVEMAITHEEADTMIIQQVASVETTHDLVVADGTDVFALLCHFVFHGDITGHIMMISPIRGRTVIDNNASVDNNRAIMGHLLAVHGLTGCDTAIYHGIGKGKVLRSNPLSRKGW